MNDIQFSLSIMDETGMTRELLLAPTPSQDVTYLVSSLSLSLSMMYYLFIINRGLPVR